MSRPSRSEDEDDEEDQSVALCDGSELKPKVLETFDEIANLYKKLRKLQDQGSSPIGEELSPSQERRYKKLRERHRRSRSRLSLNNNRIEALVEQLYDINKRLVMLEGACCAWLESYMACRATDFLKEYQGNELDPNWLKRVGRLTQAAGRICGNEEKDRIKDIRDEIQTLAHRNRPRRSRVPPHRPQGAEGRARSPPSPRRRWWKPTSAS
jgi:RNA polymerase primary sigma factor